MLPKILNSSNIINIYRYGSHVYGTNHEHSDEDYIAICRVPIKSGDINVHIYSFNQFMMLLHNHDIAALECYYLGTIPNENVLKVGHYIIDFKLDLQKLRVSISTISSNSWVKGKKKLIVTGDYDKYLGIKSIFHCLRILDYGIQIATDGRISDYGSMNFVFQDLMKMAENDESITLWEAIDTKYRKMYHAKSSQFKELCPKNLEAKNSRSKIINILKSYNVDPQPNLVDEILMEINK